MSCFVCFAFFYIHMYMNFEILIILFYIYNKGDALQQKLTGVPSRVSRPTDGLDDGQLWAMEVDATAALQEFQDLVQSTLGSSTTTASSSSSGMLGGMGGMLDIKKDFGEILSGVKDPPPGTDEIVALTNIMKYLDDGFIGPDGKKVKIDSSVVS